MIWLQAFSLGWGQAGHLALAQRLKQQGCRGDRHVQGLHHAAHGDEQRFIHQISGLIGQPPFLGPKHEGGGSGEVALPVVLGIHSEMGSVEAEPFRFELADGCFGIGMIVQRYPFLAALGRAVEGAWPKGIKAYNPIISGQLTREEIELSSKDENRPLVIKSSDIEISNSEKKTKKYIPLSKRQDKPDSALWLIRQHNILKDSQIAKLVGITKNSVTAIRNKSYWNYNNLNPKDPVALNLFTQKDLVEAIEKAERRVKREKKTKRKSKIRTTVSKLMNKINRHKFIKVLINRFFGGSY